MEISNFGWTGGSSGGGGGGNAVILLGSGTGSSYRCGNSNTSDGNYSTSSGGCGNQSLCNAKIRENTKFIFTERKV
jgi:hypothetical protein